MTRLPRWLLAVFVVVLAAIPGVVVALVMTAGGAPAPMQRLDPPPRQNHPLPQPDVLGGQGMSTADVTERSAPSVVSILSTAAAPAGLPPFCNGMDRVGPSLMCMARGRGSSSPTTAWC
jgi:hypothetical protein